MKIKETCGRCGRATERLAGLEEVQTLLSKENLKKEKIETLQEYAKTLTEEYPQIVIFSRLNSPNYQVNTLDNLCNLAGEKRNKGCYQRIITLLKDMLRSEDSGTKPKTKKPKEKKLNGKKEEKA
jgi:hypothetical protein